MDTPTSPPVGLFDRMAAFSRREKLVRLAYPADVLGEKVTWKSPEDERAAKELPAGRGPRPLKVELEIRPGAETLDFQVVPLTDLQREMSERILDSAQPPQVILEETPEKVGMPPKRVPAGYDFEAPKYLSELRDARARQDAFVVLHGTVGLRESVPGDADDAKVKSLREKLDSRMIGWLAIEILNFTYAGGDKADFFTSDPSPASPG